MALPRSTAVEIQWTHGVSRHIRVTIPIFSESPFLFGGVAELPTIVYKEDYTLERSI